MTCPDCTAAQTEPYHGGYHVGCSTCEVRAMSNAPRDIREKYLWTVRDEAARDRMRIAIVAEYHRRKALLDDIARRALGLAA